MSRNVWMDEGTTLRLSSTQYSQACKRIQDAIDAEPEGGGLVTKACDGWHWHMLNTEGEHAITCESESLYDNEDPLTFLSLIADLVPARQAVAMRDEYGYHWRYYFDGQRVYYQEGYIVYVLPDGFDAPTYPLPAGPVATATTADQHESGGEP